MEEGGDLGQCDPSSVSFLGGADFKRDEEGEEEKEGAEGGEAPLGRDLEGGLLNGDLFEPGGELGVAGLSLLFIELGPL